MQTKSIDTPLTEITLRRYEKPYNLNKRELVRKLCLSIGLLNPGDSRDIIVDVLYVLMEARQERRKLSSDEIREQVLELRSNLKMDDLGTAASNIRRQVRRLRELFLVEKVKNDYRITEFGKLDYLFSEKIERMLIPSIMERMREYLAKLDESFPHNEEQNDKL
jgi:predicted transcriptional regulator